MLGCKILANALALDHQAAAGWARRRRTRVGLADAGAEIAATFQGTVFRGEKVAIDVPLVLQAAADGVGRRRETRVG